MLICRPLVLNMLSALNCSLGFTDVAYRKLVGRVFGKTPDQVVNLHTATIRNLAALLLDSGPADRLVASGSRLDLGIRTEEGLKFNPDPSVIKLIDAMRFALSQPVNLGSASLLNCFSHQALLFAAYTQAYLAENGYDRSKIQDPIDFEFFYPLEEVVTSRGFELPIGPLDTYTVGLTPIDVNYEVVNNPLSGCPNMLSAHGWAVPLDVMRTIKYEFPHANVLASQRHFVGGRPKDTIAAFSLGRFFGTQGHADYDPHALGIVFKRAQQEHRKSMRSGAPDIPVEIMYDDARSAKARQSALTQAQIRQIFGLPDPLASQRMRELIK